MTPRDIRNFAILGTELRIVYWKIFEDAIAGRKFTRIPENLFADDMREYFADKGFSMYFDDGLKIWELSWHPGYLKERHG
jgi:hypothetical protein